MTDKIYTIGHSTHPIDEFIDIINEYKIDVLVDVRSVPHSSYNPQYDQKNLKKSLEDDNIVYIHLESLGGFRNPVPNSINDGWHNKRFQGYADYMLTDDFLKGLNILIGLLKKYNLVIMCSEAVPWRCHRSLIADQLIIRKINVYDIYNVNTVKKHKLNKMAHVNKLVITYPPEKKIK